MLIDSEQTLARREVARIRRTRCHPRPTQFDYLHLKRVLDDLSAVIRELDGPIQVLDVYCGARPYEELLPAGATCIGFDIDERYGVADVVSSEFLPFEDSSFDVVLCTEAFHYVPDPRHGVAEIRRVLRRGGRVILTVPLVWEYDRAILEHRFTGPELRELFAGWDAVEVVENGGYVVSWVTLTNRMANLVQVTCSRSRPVRWVTWPVFSAFYVVANMLGIALDHVERRIRPRRLALPMNLLLTAVRPIDGDA